MNRHKNRLEPWEILVREAKDLVDLYEMASDEGDSSMESEIRQNYLDIKTRYEKMRILELLSDEHDPDDAFLTIHAGAGGTEACDWASMLYRMYTRWIEDNKMKYSLIDLQEAEGGIKSVTIQVTGDYAYGYLKGETGVHRLVRISPFDSGGRRHTSFTSVYASPVVDEDINIDIKPEDLRVDTFRSGGAGGQHVNTTDSAVRFTHLPTGVVVQCQNERSQIKNRDIAMKMLKSRLFDYYKEQQDLEREKNSVEKKDISWGNQIRSYVFQPYTMVKDTRTRWETGNIQGVMDGDLDDFIEAYLKYIWDQKIKAQKGGI